MSMTAPPVPTTARAAAASARARAPQGAAPDGVPRRWLAVGDPQTTVDRFFRFLDQAGALGDDGWLHPEVGLVSIGDHFDYGNKPDEAAVDGLAILRWLAAHPPQRVSLIAGNHDLSRVTELAFESDASFSAARSLASELPKAIDPAPLRAEFAKRFPRIPTPDMAARDYCAFREEQRALVQRLLLEGRFALGAATVLGGAPALLVHAGLSMRELDILGIPEARDPRVIARALNRWLADAVAQVEPAWRRGDKAALALEPLHVTGTTGREGGGFLYHRPVNAQRPNRKETEADLSSDRPRRFDATRLPRGLQQIVGHTAHKRSREELVPWVTPRAVAKERGGGLRTLRMDEAPVYDLGVLPHRDGAATVVMIDCGMSDHELEDIELLSIAEPTTA